MSDAWTVVLGGAIGLAGSAMGSLLAPHLQARSERQRRAEERAEVEERRWQEVTGALIAEFSSAALANAAALAPGGADARFDASLLLSSVQDRLAIELRSGEDSISDLMQLVVPRLLHPAATPAWASSMGGLTGIATSALAAWRRRDSTADEALGQVRAVIDRYDRETGFVSEEG